MNPGPWLREDPSGAVEQAFRKIEEDQMRGLPVCNSALTTETVGFTRWQDQWIGCLITPWTLQLLMLPATEDAEALEENDVRIWEFPCGSVTFMTSENPDIGMYQACALLSPLHEFPSQEVIRQTSIEVMEVLFQPPLDTPGRTSATRIESGRLDVDDAARSASKSTRRDFLRMPSK